MALASAAILVPVIAAALLAGTSVLDRRRAALTLAIAAAAAVAVLCAVLAERALDEPVVAWLGGWEPRARVAVGIDLYADGLGAGLASFAGVLTVAALVASLRLEGTPSHLLAALVLLFLAGVIGFCLAGDLFTAFVFFELMSVASYALAGLLVDRRSPVEGTLNFAVTNTAGSVLMLTGIALLYGRTGALNLAQLGTALEDGGATAAVAFALIASGFLVKAAIVPFHFWLADTYAAAPTAICVLFAGVMSELGIYGLARAYWTVFAGPLDEHAELIRGVLLALGALTAVVGALMCVAQRLLKRLLAFATVSHMGVLLIGIALLVPGGLAGAAVYLVGDGLVKAGLFLATGALIERHGTGEVRELAGRGRDAPLLGVVIAAGALALAGLPPFGPFLGRARIEDAATALGHWWLLVALVIAGALTGGAVLRAAREVFLGRAPTGAGEAPDREEAARGESAALLRVQAIVLVGLGLAWGLVPGLSGVVASASEAFIDRAGYVAAVLDGVAVRPPDAGGEAPSATAWTLGLLSAALAVALAARDRLPAAPRRLRALHSGRAGDYLAWLATGAAALALVWGLGAR